MKIIHRKDNSLGLSHSQCFAWRFSFLREKKIKVAIFFITDFIHSLLSPVKVSLLASTIANLRTDCVRRIYPKFRKLVKREKRVKFEFMVFQEQQKIVEKPPRNKPQWETSKNQVKTSMNVEHRRVSKMNLPDWNIKYCISCERVCHTDSSTFFFAWNLNFKTDAVCVRFAISSLKYTSRRKRNLGDEREATSSHSSLFSLVIFQFCPATLKEKCAIEHTRARKIEQKVIPTLSNSNLHHCMLICTENIKSSKWTRALGAHTAHGNWTAIRDESWVLNKLSWEDLKFT